MARVRNGLGVGEAKRDDEVTVPIGRWGELRIQAVLCQRIDRAPVAMLFDWVQRGARREPGPGCWCSRLQLFEIKRDEAVTVVLTISLIEIERGEAAGKKRALGAQYLVAGHRSPSPGLASSHHSTARPCDRLTGSDGGPPGALMARRGRRLFYQSLYLICFIVTHTPHARFISFSQVHLISIRE
jgi:hypothetical protein